MIRYINYETKLLLPKKAVPFFESALEDTAAAVLTVMIEKGAQKGLWELQAIFEGKPDEKTLQHCLKTAAENADISVPSFKITPLPDKNWFRNVIKVFNRLQSANIIFTARTLPINRPLIKSR